MQDNINYKIMTKINNWFANDNEVWDYDSTYYKPADTTFYCNHCQTHKSIKLQKVTFDSLNRKLVRCTSCASKITKPIKPKGIKK
jgi:predicted SprT family Zn-dependent metalloprotease